MTTVNDLRTGHLNRLLGRVDASTEPWSDTDCNAHLTSALRETWPELGTRATGTVATNPSSDTYAMPGSIVALSRVEVLDANGLHIDRVTKWRLLWDADPPTKIIIEPLIAGGFTLRMSGWKPFSATGSDLPTRLEAIVAYKAAALAYGELAGKLANSERQQSLDSGRVVDYPTAVGLSAYYERRYIERTTNDPARVSFAPRAAHRG
ncbi:MAG TPA: hypothetical protein VIV06_10815 [Candidatus Limnocylindrales bacterium]